VKGAENYRQEAARLKNKNGQIGFWAVAAIGVGGMVGGGIFAVLGLAVQLAAGGTPLAFFFAGLVALLTGYSYAKLSVAFPSQGGTVEFINQAFGEGIFTGALNILLLISYVVMLSLYAYAFGSYGSSFFPREYQPLAKHLLISGAVVLFTVLNVVGSKAVGRAEEWIVGFKILILLGFAGIGFWSVDAHRLSPGAWSPFLEIVAGGMVIFLAYEGFELIANSAKDVKDAGKTLPAAYYSTIVFVIILYVLVSLVTVGNLPVAGIVAAKDYALAVAARPFLGQTGFTLIAVAALLSTGSAINATLYGTTRVSYIIAKDGELPKELEEKIWNRPVEGLFISSGLTLLIANLFDLSSLSIMGSAGFLIIFAAVSAANLRLRRRTGSSAWIASAGICASLCAFGALIWHVLTTSSKEIWILVIMLAVSFAVEAGYRKITGRVIRPSIKGN
jgi:amino acid transporter